MKRQVAFVALLLLQATCSLFFLWDFLPSLLGIRRDPIPWTLWELAEVGAALGLTLGVAMTAAMLRQSVLAAKRAEDSVRIASGDFMKVVHDRFDAWRLTPAERDVALFSIKGLSVAEIASLRQTSEGTVKAQTNAIYRKAGVSGRSQLLSTFIEDLIEPQMPIEPAPEPPRLADAGR
ncbi:Bacterial regulatory proteins, luxR family [Roseivivax jejudonensis]|uniref:Bacterial regulatory proteins, luxR family n=1 Tax=Roseivivax jejudonensis TaxID=1529041 RepID=A0A1X6ZFX8_9RHOB|nr:helix-turn-helix transcriptional regulator [Roseivivax jejudonensis]SLN50177.1 Bacterial regulatory proteins, luxR family [Roseivivax jejudonensis]